MPTTECWITEGDGVAALRRETRELAPLAPREVLVRMTAASLNYRDLLVVDGRGTWKPTAPRVPVSDGVVVDVGAEVTRVARGDRVAGIFLPRWIDGELTPETYVEPLGGAAADGVMTTHRAFDEQALVRVPAHLSDAEASTLPVAALTAWHALARCGVKAGDTVLIEGTGGVSIFALQFAHAIGARTIVLSSSAAKLDAAQRLGADVGIDYRENAAWEPIVLAATEGRGVDHVVEVVGGEHLDRALRVVRIGGAIAFIGLMAGLRASVDTYAFVTRNVTIHGIETGSRAMFEAMNAFIETHRLKPVVAATFPFARFPQALAALERADRVGKLVVEF